MNKALNTLQIRLQRPVKPFETDELKSTSFGVSLPFGMEDNSARNIKVMNHESPVKCEAVEVAYEGEDEHEENNSIKRNFSDFDLKAHEANSSEESPLRKMEFAHSFNTEVNEQFEKIVEKDGGRDADMMQSGHVSDPGIGKAQFWASPKLKRSCSNLETSGVIRKMADNLPLSKSHSYEEMQELAERMGKDITPGSPASVMTHGSADKVMLKKHSSSQVLPSRSKRLWWKLFLWSHRNLHMLSSTAKQKKLHTSAVFNQQGGYASDTLEPNGGTQFSQMESPVSFTGQSFIKDHTDNETDKQSWGGFHKGISSLWPQNQWLAFTTESSPFARVEEWVKGLDTEPSLQLNEDDNNEEGITFPPSPETGRSPTRYTTHLTRRSDVNLSEEILHANSIIQSLNSSSTVAHISGIGLKAIPSMSCYSSLRFINLSNNFIGMLQPNKNEKDVCLHIFFQPILTELLPGCSF